MLKLQECKHSHCGITKISERLLLKFRDGTYGESWEFNQASQRHLKIIKIINEGKFEFLFSAFSRPSKETWCGYYNWSIKLQDTKQLGKLLTDVMVTKMPTLTN